MAAWRVREDGVFIVIGLTPENDFDDKAKALTREALFEKLPGLIFGYADAISFRSLFSAISNGTPATSQILRLSLYDLAKEGHIVIKDQTGATTRREGVQHECDLIQIPRQKRLFF
jgi:hypothetical protein